MCVTGAELWNTSSSGPFRCGHPEPISPATLEVHPVDAPTAAVDDGEARKSCPAARSGLRLGLAAFADLLGLLVDAEDDHERLEHHAVDAERQQQEDRLDDDQREQAARDAAGLEADDEDRDADERGPDREQHVEDLDDLRRDERAEAEVEERPEEALLARLLRPRLRGLDARDSLPLRRRAGRALARLRAVARRLVRLLVVLVVRALPEGRVRLVLRRVNRLVLRGVSRLLRRGGSGVGLVLRRIGRRAVALLSAGRRGRRGVGGLLLLLPGRTALRQGLVLAGRLEGRFWWLTGHRFAPVGGLVLEVRSTLSCRTRTGAMTSAIARSHIQ